MHAFGYWNSIKKSLAPSLATNEAAYMKMSMIPRGAIFFYLNCAHLEKKAAMFILPPYPTTAQFI